MTRFGVILPTSGRPTLGAALASCARAGIQPDDTVMLMVDGGKHAEVAEAAALEAALPCSVVLCVYDPPLGGIGGPLRNIALHQLAMKGTADWAIYLDDDDELADGALGVIRETVAADPERPHMFRMHGTTHGTLWRDRSLMVGSVGGPMFVHRIDANRMGIWDGARCQDQRFIVETIRRCGDELAWHEDVIYLVRPHEWRAEEDVEMYSTMGPPIERPMFAFVTGHGSPVACPVGARYVRRHPDGEVMEAEGPEDTLEACASRWQAKQEAPAAPRRKAKQPAPATPADEE